MESKSPPAAAVALSLWLAAASFYALTGAGHSTSVDGMLIFLAAHELIETGRPAVPEVPHTESHRKRGLDGRWYPKYGPGLILAHLPALSLARLGDPLRPDLGESSAPALRRDEFYAQLTNAGITASTVTLVFLAGLALGYGVGTSLLVAGVVGAASPLWTYAHVDGTEALQALGFAGALYAGIRARGAARPEAAAFVAGGFLALAIAAKVTNVVVAPCLLLFLGVKVPPGKRLRAVLASAMPVAAAALLLGLFNAWRFGAFLDTGYDLVEERFDRSIATGALVLLVSPQFGLLVFFPSLLLAVFGAREAFRRFPSEASFAAAVAGTLLLVYSGWWAFWGMNWGPRFLVPAIPLFALFLLPVAASGSRALRTAVIATALVGLSPQILSVTVSFFPQVSVVYEELGLGRREGLVRDPAIAPLRIALWWNRLAAVRAHDAKELPVRILDPPWEERHPWRDPARAAARLPAFAGLDLWAVPVPWRREYVSIWPFGETIPKPHSGRLCVFLLAGLALGIAGLAGGIRRRPEEIGSDDRTPSAARFPPR